MVVAGVGLQAAFLPLVTFLEKTPPRYPAPNTPPAPAPNRVSAPATNPFDFEDNYEFTLVVGARPSNL